MNIKNEFHANRIEILQPLSRNKNFEYLKMAKYNLASYPTYL
jgi:hypothetical protein